MKKILTITMTVLLFWISVSDLFGASGINRKINFQGKVVNKGVGVTDGTNVADGNYDFKFSLWSTVSAGTSLWSENWNSGTTQVPVSSGIFSVALGTYATFPPTVDFNSDSLYLSVNYNGDGEMSPRIQMAAVPYAFNAEKVGGLTVTNTTGTLTVPNGKTIAFGDGFTTTGVGITLNQSLATTDMVSFGGLSIGGSASVTTNLSVGGSVTFSNLPVGAGTTILYIGVGGKLVQGTLPPGGTAYTATNGLNLNGSAFGLGGTLSALTKIDFNSNNMALFGTGSLGLGLTNPGYKLHVAGDIGTTSLTAGGFLSVGTSASIGTNLAVGGSLTLSSAPAGVGSTVLYISSTGVVTRGTLPDTGVGKSRVVIISPEYPGASLSADGSGTTSVAMTSDNTLNAGGIGWKNYYQLSSTNASLQDYSVIVRVTLPTDFDSWETGSCPGLTCALEFDYQTGVADTADNYISYIVSNDSDTPGTAVCSIGSTASTNWGKSGCAESTLNDAGAPEWDAAGEIAVVRIKMAAKNTASALTRAGDIILRYKSKF